MGARILSAAGELQVPDREGQLVQRSSAPCADREVWWVLGGSAVVAHDGAVIAEFHATTASIDLPRSAPQALTQPSVPGRTLEVITDQAAIINVYTNSRAGKRVASLRLFDGCRQHDPRTTCCRQQRLGRNIPAPSGP